MLWGGVRDPDDMTHQKTAYAYAGEYNIDIIMRLLSVFYFYLFALDTLLLYNRNVACGTSVSGECGSIKRILETRRAKFPAQYWNDPVFGRLVNWP